MGCLVRPGRADLREGVGPSTWGQRGPVAGSLHRNHGRLSRLRFPGTASPTRLCLWTPRMNSRPTATWSISIPALPAGSSRSPRSTAPSESLSLSPRGPSLSPLETSKYLPAPFICFLPLLSPQGTSQRLRSLTDEAGIMASSGLMAWGLVSGSF